MDYTYSRKVHYYETDKMSIVHHTNYIRMFEEARLGLMDEAGFPYDKVEEAGIIIPVVDAYARYHVSLKYGDTFTVVPELKVFNGVRMEFSYKVYVKETGELSCEGHTSHCFLYRDRPVNIKRKHPEIYERFTEMLR